MGAIMGDVAIPLPLEVVSAVKTFRQGATVVKALNGLDLTVRQGEFIAIMGASGSGKSTLLHAIAGLTKIDSGKIIVDGVDISTLSDSRLTRFRRSWIGLIFQSFNLIPLLSAADNIRLPIMAAPESDTRIASLLGELGIAARRDHKPDSMSGGEQQRVAIARALAADPTIILADEPTGSLDSVTGQEICSLLRGLSKEHHRTILIVTHEPTVAMWADRIVILMDGVKIADFPTDNLHDPQALAAAYHRAIQVQLLSTR